jgi:2-oxo-4-hydroxy-4-carboxy--5-ureidoimidazoline (OHCU) decarboxylase
MRELPRHLSVDELAELFEGRTALVERLAVVENPLEDPQEVIAALSEEEKIEALNAHPAIGARRLAYQNRVYEEKFGFRFVVFVAGRPKREILEVLSARIGNTREEELEAGLRELVAIARDRWTRT